MEDHLQQSLVTGLDDAPLTLQLDVVVFVVEHRLLIEVDEQVVEVPEACGLITVDDNFRGVAVVHAEAAVGEMRAVKLNSLFHSVEFELVGRGEFTVKIALIDNGEPVLGVVLVLVAAGGQVCTLAGDVLRYGKPGLDNPHFYARGL